MEHLTHSKAKHALAKLTFWVWQTAFLMSLLYGCVSNETSIEHYSHSTLNFRGEHITQTTHNQWTTSQPPPINANIRVSPNDSRFDLIMSAPTRPIQPYPILYPNLINDDCYTMKPVIVNGEQATIIQPCK